MGRAARGLVAVTVSVTAAACAGSRAARNGAPAERIEAPTLDGASRRAVDSRSQADAFPTLLVDNTSGSQITVYSNGRRLGTATRGRSCLRIPQMVGELHLDFVAHHTHGYRAPIAFLEESRHWRIAFRPGVSIKYDVLSLAPTRTSCRT